MADTAHNGRVRRSDTQVYLHLVRAQEAGEQPPSVRALAAATGLHTSVVHRCIQRLRLLGLLPTAAKGAVAVNRPTYRVVANSPRNR